MAGEDIAHLEKLAADAWPPTVEQRHGGWVLRFNFGVTRRANSVLAASGVPDLPAAMAVAEDFYRQRGLRPCYRLTPASQPGRLDRVLADRGFTAEGATDVMTAPMDRLVSGEASGFRLTLGGGLSTEWARVYGADGGGEHRLRLVERIAQPKVFVLAEAPDGGVGAGLAVLDAGWAGIYAMQTAVPHRRRGIGWAVFRGIREWALGQGAKNFYLAVERDNAPALAFYGKAGFRVAYCYHYRVAAQAI